MAAWLDFVVVVVVVVADVGLRSLWLFLMSYFSLHSLSKVEYADTHIYIYMSTDCDLASKKVSKYEKARAQERRECAKNQVSRQL